MLKAERFIQVAVPGPFPHGLEYQADAAYVVGQRVLVPLRGRTVVGIVLAVHPVQQSTGFALKSALKILDEMPLFDQNMRDLLAFVQSYYHASIGDVYYTALPQLLCKGKPLESKREPVLARAAQTDITPACILNSEQAAVVATLLPHLNHWGVHLLEGVTGSGKTEVYLELVAEVLKSERSVLVLVPEINLTPQTLKRFQARFGGAVVAYHSGLTEAEKRRVWREVSVGQVRLVIGTRSAVFLPLQDLGLLIIDEEHDGSYKQSVGVAYSAKSVAIKRAMQQQCAIVLGSATPSVEALYFVREGRYMHHVLASRAKGNALPSLKLIDMRSQPYQAGLSPLLLQAIHTHLNKGQQVLIFLNRRGYAPILLCRSCGSREICPDCEMSYTLHQKPAMLICHHCGKMVPIPKNCSACQHAELISLGQGTEQLEEVLQTQFPHARLVRLDQDSLRVKGSLEESLRRIHSGEAEIVIGTQMLAKGHDFAKMTLIGVVDLDYGLFAPDFRSIERMGQLLMQVAGRAGRGLVPGEVLIQTHVPEHPLLHCLLKEGYHAFALKLLEERQVAAWPPFQHMALFRAEHRDEVKLMAFLNEIKNKLKGAEFVRVLGPVAATLRKKALFYRAQLLLESPKRQYLHQALSQLQLSLRAAKNIPRYTIDVDPLEV